MPKLTKTLLASAAKGFVWDSEVRGLAARVQATSISFILDYRHGGKSRRMVLGRFGSEMSIQRARQLAAEMKLRVRLGFDPLGEVQARRRPAGLTVADVVARWLKANQGEWSATTSRTYQKVLSRNVVQPFGKRVLADISRAQWAALFGDIESASVAGLARRAVGSMTSWAREQGLLEAVADLPKRHRRLDPRSRVVTDDELVRIWAATSGLGAPQARFAKFIMATATRSGAAAVCRAEWLTANCLMIPGDCVGLKRQAGQRDQHHRVHLSPWSLEQLGELPSAGLLFGRIHPQAVLKVLKAASGVSNWTWHDVRRSARTWMAANGISRDGAETALGHTVVRGVEAHYNFHRYEAEARLAFERWQAHVRQLVEGEAPANVVVFRK
jgi:integrase